MSRHHHHPTTTTTTTIYANGNGWITVLHQMSGLSHSSDTLIDESIFCDMIAMSEKYL